MKQFLPILAILAVSVTATAQTKADTSKRVISVPKQATDSTPLLTFKDLQELANLLQDYPAKYANPITNWLQQRFAQRAQEYALKPNH